MSRHTYIYTSCRYLIFANMNVRLGKTTVPIMQSSRDKMFGISIFSDINFPIYHSNFQQT